LRKFYNPPQQDKSTITTAEKIIILEIIKTLNTDIQYITKTKVPYPAIKEL
jgi:hypothetical protein